MTLLQSYTREEVAEYFGVPTSTIAWYQRTGLLSPLLPRSIYTISRIYRGYGPHHIREIRKILDMKENNRTLRDMRDVLHPVADE